MLKNYIKTALRTLSRNGMQTTINVFGLSLGISCAIVLFLMADFINGYDDFQENKDRIYRLVNSAKGQGGQNDYTPGVPVPLPDALRLDFPEFEKVVFTRNHFGEMHFTIHPEADQPQYFELNEDRIVYTEQQYLDVFTINWLAGKRENSLIAPNSLIVAKSVADKFFPDESALGKVIKLNKEIDLTITGIMADPPANTDMPFDMLVSLSTVINPESDNRWNSVSSDDQCYILLEKSDDPLKYEARLDDFQLKHFGEESTREYDLQPMSDLHFNELYSNYSFNTFSKNQLLVMVIIAVFLIVTACINFVNLSTAVAIKRSREIGVRKVLGGTRKQLVGQFLTETFGVIFVSLLIGIGLAELLLFYVNPFLEISLDIPWSSLSFYLILFASLIVMTFLSGFYPAMVLSGYNPALALKNLITAKSSGGVGLRKGLVVFQFFISQVFIIGTIVTISQLQFIKNADLGYNTEALINIRLPEEDPVKMKTLKNELQRLSGVKKASLQFSNPSSGSVSVSNFKLEGNPEDFYTAMKFADEDYIEIYDIELLAGRNLRQSDTLREVVVNEKLLKYIGHEGTPQEIVGKQIRVWGTDVPIVGVMKDFHAVSLHDEVMSLMLFSHTNAYRLITLKVDMKSFDQNAGKIASTWRSIYPEYEYEHTFIDEQLAEFYEGERKMGIFFSAASGIAIFIGCLGLFGLASFMVTQKVKEIGVRKVLGASVFNIMTMFSKTYFQLIGIAFILAAPVAWFGMNEWLKNFEYRVELGPLFFIAALLTTLLIALITVGFKSLRAAKANPVDSLRRE